MTSLLAELSATAGAAFAAEGMDTSYGQAQVSDRPDLAQFQVNGALAAAKKVKANPRAIAEKVAARLKASPLLAEAGVAGPGFINLKLKDEALEARLQTLARAPASALPESGKGKRLVID